MATHPDNYSEAEEIDRVADEFESAWRSQGKTPLRDYLVKVPTSAWPRLLRELIHIDWDYRLRIGETPSLADYQALFSGPVGTLDPEAPLSPEQWRSLQAELPGAQPTASPTLIQAQTSGDDVPALPQIDGYQILTRLGEGGMGTVWRALQISTRREVALKLMSAAALGSEKSRHRFDREIALTAKLEHPNIARVYDGGLRHGIYFYAMELIDGRPLDEHVKHHKQNRRQILELMQTICLAVQHAHQKGIIHCDLKPSNIMVDAQGRPRVLDFGLAKGLLGDDEEMTISIDGMVAGTPIYMSPEQAAGKRNQLDTRSDVYTLGVILYRLVTGKFPHETTGSSLTLIRRIAEEEVIRPRAACRDIDVELDALLLKALASDPAARYSSAGAMAADLDNYLRGEPLSAKAPTIAYLLAKRVRKNRKPLAVASILVIAAALAGYFAVQTSRTRQIARLSGSLDLSLARNEWTPEHLDEMNSIALQIEQLSPDGAAAARKRVSDRFIESLRADIAKPTIGQQDATRIASELDLLSPRAPDSAAALRIELAQKRHMWLPVFGLASPFAGLGQVFDSQHVVVEGGALRNRYLNDPLCRTRVVCNGNMEVAAWFGAGWQQNEALGLALNVGPAAVTNKNVTGYLFLLRLPGAASEAVTTAPSATAATSSSAGRTRAPQVRRPVPILQLLRNGVLLHEQELPGAAIRFGELQLIVRREASRLTFQVNNATPLTFDDVFPLGSANSGVVAVYWPENAALKELHGTREALPAHPSPMERGDALYAEGKQADALIEFEAQARNTADADDRQNARYKQGLCMLALKRDEEAKSLFEQLASEQGNRWPALAGCQLWLMALREGHIDEADAIFDQLESRMPFTKLAIMLPDDMRQLAMNYYRGSEVGKKSATRARRLERVIALETAMGQSRFGDGGEPGFLVALYHQLGEFEHAEHQAKAQIRAVDLTNPDAEADLLTCEHYCWIHIYRHTPSAALSEINRLLVVSPGVYRPRMIPLLVERARLHVAMDHWDLAEQDLDNYFQHAKDPRAHCNWHGGAYLMKGFCREHAGDQAGAMKAWESGVIFADPAKPGSELFYGDAANGTQRLYALMLGSLTGRWTDSDCRAFMNNMLDHNAGPVGALTRNSEGMGLPSTLLRDIWLDETGHAAARAIAFHQASQAEVLHLPYRLTGLQFIRRSLRIEKFSADQQKVLGEMLDELIDGYMGDRLSPVQTANLFFTWKGNMGRFPPGWAAVAPTLDPAVRGPVAYLMGLRYRRLNRPADAAALFRAAAADAPAKSPLQRLIADETSHPTTTSSSK